jgi:hypothetical protein
MRACRRAGRWQRARSHRGATCVSR